MVDCPTGRGIAIVLFSDALTSEEAIGREGNRRGATQRKTLVFAAFATKEVPHKELAAGVGSRINNGSGSIWSEPET